MPHVMTVRGPISPEELGITMCHTHLLCNLAPLLPPAAEASRIALADLQFSLENLGRIRRNALAVRANLILGDVDEAIAEAMEYPKNGGRTIVEVTLPGIGRDPVGLRQISYATGLHVVSGTGWYVAASHPPIVKQKSTDELAAIMVKEIAEGIGSTGIRAGVIGEIAMGRSFTGEPFVPDEEKVLRAAARAQARTGVALTIHPNLIGKFWDTYIDIVEEEGANPSKCYLSHMEAYMPDVEYQKQLLARGVYISYDQFGHEERNDAIAPGIGFVPDRMRVDGIVELCKQGYADRIVLANEAAFRTCYLRGGGFGYGHLLQNIVPELRYRGVTDAQIHTMLVENPARLLAVE